MTEPAPQLVQIRRSRRREVRPHTISVKRLSKTALELGRQRYPEEHYWRPKTRGECEQMMRPWRVANGKQDGPESVRRSVCRGCPHGQERAGLSAAPLPVEAAQEIAREAAARTHELPAPTAKKPGRAGRGPRGSIVGKAPNTKSEATASCQNPKCGKQFALNKHGPKRKLCHDCSPSNPWYEKKPPLEPAMCASGRCGARFQPARRGQRYCSPACQKFEENARARAKLKPAPTDQYTPEPAQELPPAEFELREHPAPLSPKPSEPSNAGLTLVCQNPECLKAFASPNKFGPKRRFCGECVPPDGAAATCAREACGAVFVLQWRQQRYCSARCQKLGEQERAKQRYHERAREHAPAPTATTVAPMERDAARGIPIASIMAGPGLGGPPYSMPAPAQPRPRSRFTVRLGGFEIDCDDVASVRELAKAFGCEGSRS